MLPKYRVEDANKIVLDKKKRNKRLTTEEYIKEVSEITDDIKVIDEYINASTPILHECLICGRKWPAVPTNILRGHLCKVCANFKTHEEYLSDLYLVNPYVEILDIYNGVENKNEFRCKICGYEWYASPSSPLRGKGCLLCGRKRMADKRAKTNEQFLKELSEVNPDIEALQEYRKQTEKMDFKCKICDLNFNTWPASVLQGHSCPHCSRIFVSEEDFLSSVNSNINILDDYDGLNKNYSCECKICGYSFIRLGYSLRKGTGCTQCYFKSKEISKDDFLKRLNDYHNNKITLYGEYVNITTPTFFKCEDCKHIWEADPYKVCSYTGCPNCFCSHGERKIKNFLDLHKITYDVQKKYNDLVGVGNKLLSYDFYLPNYNFLIEFQGEQHEHPIEHFGGVEKFKQQQEHDRRKREYAKLNKINLLEIWYYDINNIEEILNEILYNLNSESLTTTGVV